MMNPRATRLATNWQKLDLVLMLEFDFPLREVILQALREKLSGKDEYEDE